MYILSQDKSVIISLHDDRDIFVDHEKASICVGNDVIGYYDEMSKARSVMQFIFVTLINNERTFMMPEY